MIQQCDEVGVEREVAVGERRLTVSARIEADHPVGGRDRGEFSVPLAAVEQAAVEHHDRIVRAVVAGGLVDELAAEDRSTVGDHSSSSGLVGHRVIEQRASLTAGDGSPRTVAQMTDPAADTDHAWRTRSAA